MRVLARKLARRSLRSFSSSSSVETIGAFARAALRAANADSIAVTAADSSESSALALSWTYGELLDRVDAFARTLRDLGYTESSAPLGVRGRNGGEVLVAYLGTAAAATRARSAKTSDDLRAVFGDGRTRGTFVPFEDAEAAGAIVGAHEPIAFDGGSLRDAVILAEAARAAYRRRGDEDDAAVEEYSKCDDAMFYFGGSERPTTGMTLVTHARRAGEALGMSSEDATCVPVPLGHAMGFGFGALATLARGGRVVLPSTVGSAGDGARARDAMCQAALDAIESEACTLVVADSHLAEAAAAAKTPTTRLRGGFIKVGSGDAIGACEPVSFWDTQLLTVGTPKKPRSL
jgi:acyl-CoA synthetase (AMP-forming)/AMP-acid ligase II